MDQEPRQHPWFDAVRVRFDCATAPRSAVWTETLLRYRTERCAAVRFRSLFEDLAQDGPQLHHDVAGHACWKKGATAIRTGFLRHDPTKGVELPRSNKRRIMPPTKEQVWRLIDCAGDIGGHANGILYVDAFTGLRRNEILAYRFCDIDWLNKEVVVTPRGFQARCDRWCSQMGVAHWTSEIRKIKPTRHTTGIRSPVTFESPGPHGASGSLYPRPKVVF
jgi:integrase